MHVGNNRGGSNCSLVAWILGLPRLQQRNSRAAGNRYRDAPCTFLQGQSGYIVKALYAKKWSLLVANGREFAEFFRELGKIHGFALIALGVILFGLQAMYVLISFSRNLTALRLESSISDLQSVPLQDLDASEQYEDDNHQKHEAYSTCRKVAPIPAVRPPRESAYKCQDQKHDQDSSKHCFFSF